MLNIPEHVVATLHRSETRHDAVALLLHWYGQETGRVSHAVNIYRACPLRKSSSEQLVWRDVLEGVLAFGAAWQHHPGVARLGTDHVVEFLRLEAEAGPRVSTLAIGMDEMAVDGAAVPPSTYVDWSAAAMGKALPKLR